MGIDLDMLDKSETSFLKKLYTIISTAFHVYEDTSALSLANLLRYSCVIITFNNNIMDKLSNSSQQRSNLNRFYLDNVKKYMYFP